MICRPLLFALLVFVTVFSRAQAAGYLGVAVGEPLDEKAKGAAVVKVIADSPAAKSGLAEGDIILAVNKVKIASPMELVKAIQSQKAGDEVKLKVLRGGETQKLTVTLGERPEEPPRPPSEEPQPFIGLAFAAASLPDQPDEPVALTIVQVIADGPAAEAGIKPGDVLVEFDGKKVKSYKQLVALVQAKKVGDEVDLKIERNGKTMEKKVTLKGFQPQRR